MKSRTRTHFVLVLLLALLCAFPALAANDQKVPSKYGTVTGQLRTYYLTTRAQTTKARFDYITESLAVGGYLKYETPWVADHFGAGLAGYFSMPFIDTFNQKDRSGTGLLSSRRNQAIFALGEAYFKGRYSKTEARLWRQRIDTPLINSHDNRMIPQTFEAYGVTSGDVEDLSLSAFWVDKEKGRDTRLFKSMSEIAGLDGSEGGVFMTGADWQASEALSVRFWNYYAPDLDNSFFTQAKYTFGDPEAVEYEFLFQGLDQRSVGNQDNGTYNAAEAGLQGTLRYAGLAFFLGETIMDGAQSLRNSWGSYPFFTNQMISSFNRSGEKTILVGVGYDFAEVGVDGFTANLRACFGSTPDSGIHATSNRTEYNLSMKYQASGDLDGFSILNQWAYVDGDENTGGSDIYEVRLRLQYNFQLL